MKLCEIMKMRNVFLVLIGIVALVMFVLSCSNISSLDYVKKGEEYLRTHDYDRAIEYFTKAINKGGLSTKDLAITHKYRGFAYNAKGKFSAALEDLNKAIDLYPEYYAAYSDRGVVFTEENQDNRALEDFNKAIALNPQYYMTYYNKACFYSKKNNTSEACKCLKTAIEKGYSNWSHIKNYKCFDNIRQSACYKNIMSGR
ncbi:MAG: tetratricopeptide repeat protein [Nitrospirota bacterium]